jgi:hypothetical protein
VDSYPGPLCCSTGFHICFFFFFLPVPCCFYCSGSVVYFEVRYCDTYNIALFAQYASAICGFLFFQMDFRVDFSMYVMNVIGILVRIVLNM